MFYKEQSRNTRKTRWAAQHDTPRNPGQEFRCCGALMRSSNGARRANQSPTFDVRLRVFTLWVGRLEDGALLIAAPSASVAPRAAATPTDELTRRNNDRSNGRDAQRRSVMQRPDHPAESNPPPPTQEPRTARLGVPILPAPNSEPDCEALFGEKE